MNKPLVLWAVLALAYAGNSRAISPEAIDELRSPPPLGQPTSLSIEEQLSLDAAFSGIIEAAAATAFREGECREAGGGAALTYGPDSSQQYWQFTGAITSEKFVRITGAVTFEDKLLVENQGNQGLPAFHIECYILHQGTNADFKREFGADFTARPQGPYQASGGSGFMAESHGIQLVDRSASADGFIDGWACQGQYRERFWRTGKHIVKVTACSSSGEAPVDAIASKLHKALQEHGFYDFPDSLWALPERPELVHTHPPPPPPAETIAEPEPQSEPEPPEPDADEERRLEEEALLAEMDALMRGSEDRLQANLMAIKAGTGFLKKLEFDADRLRALMKADRESITEEVILIPVLNGHREKLRKLLAHFVETKEGRDRAAEETLAFLSGIVRRVEHIYESHVFRDLDFHAYSRVLAARERFTYLKAQLALATGNTKEALRMASELQSESVSAPEGLLIEAMAHLENGDWLRFLDAAHTARRRGYEQTGYRIDRFRGSALEAAEKEIEVRILESLQEMATRERSMQEGQWEQWVKANERVPEGENHHSAYWLIHGALARGLSDSVDTLLTLLQEEGSDSRGSDFKRIIEAYNDTVPPQDRIDFTETIAQARARDAGIVYKDLARAHVGLGMIISLRKKGLSLKEIQNLNSERLKTALQERYGVRVESKAELISRLSVIRHAFQLEDLRLLASDRALVEGDLLSRELTIQVGEASRLEKATAFGKSSGNFVNGAMLLSTFAPMAQIPRGEKGVITVGEWFSSSRPVSWATEKLAGTSYGKALLEGAKASSDWSQSSRAGGATVFMGEVVFDTGMGAAIEHFMGEEAKWVYDGLAALGGTSVDTWASSYSRLLKTRTSAQAASRRIRELAMNTRRNLEQVNGLRQRAKEAIESAGESAPSRVALQQVRQELEEAVDFAPEVTTKVGHALELAESGNTRAARQSIRDADAAAEVIEERTEAALQAADQLENAARTLPPQSAETIAPRREVPPAVVEQEDVSGTVIFREVSNPGRTAGRTREGTRLPQGPTQAASGVQRSGRSASGVTRDARATASPSGIQPERPPPISRLSPSRPVPLDGPAEFLQEGDRLIRGRNFEEAATEYARQIERGHLDQNAIEILRQREAMARQMQAAAERRAGRLSSGLRSEDYAPPADQGWLEEATRMAKENGLGNPGNSAARPQAILPQNRRDLLERARSISASQNIALNEAFQSQLRGVQPHAPAWIKPLQDKFEVAHAPAEVIGSRLRQALDRPAPVSELAQIVDNGLNRAVLVTRTYRAEDLLNRLKRIKQQGEDGDVLAELMAHKDVIAEDMSFASLMGDGDRHPGNILVLPNGEGFSADFGMADIHRRHQIYRHEGTNPSHLPIWTPEGHEFMPSPDSPMFRDYVEAQMQAHLDYMIWQQRRLLEGIEEGCADMFFSSLRAEDFSGYVDRMRSNLQGELAPVVQEAMDDFRKLAPRLYEKFEFDPNLTTRLLETRLEVMEEFYGDIENRLRESVQKTVNNTIFQRFAAPITWLPQPLRDAPNPALAWFEEKEEERQAA